MFTVRTVRLLQFAIVCVMFFAVISMYAFSMSEEPQIRPDVKGFMRPTAVPPSEPPFNTSLNSFNTSLPWCSWSSPSSTFLYPYDVGHYVNETYSVLFFLFEEMFQRRGMMWVVTAGTALGAVRHGGGFNDDDGVDVFSISLKKCENGTTCSVHSVRAWNRIVRGIPTSHGTN